MYEYSSETGGIFECLDLDFFLSPWKFVQRGNGIRTVGATEFATGWGSLVANGLCRGFRGLVLKLRSA